jgi:hypothetical protein
MKYCFIIISLLVTTLLQAVETYELRKYDMVSEEAAEQFDAWMRNAGIKILKKTGAEKVGVFKPREGEETPQQTRFVLAVYKDLSAIGENVRPPFVSKSKNPKVEGFLDATKKEPSYTRVDSSLLTAFPGFKHLKEPEGKGSKDRFFELRIYESSSERMAAMKVDMFCGGGEIGIFNSVGLNSVFFGSARIAANFPQLTYMVVHEDQAASDAAWDGFRNAEGWQKLKQVEKYSGTVSHITKYLLVALPYSQIN